jgi:3-hydroxybutyryl-CoA dehydrogenase
MSNISCIGVVGAGQMGAGIAQVCGSAGIQTLLWDGNPDALKRGHTGIGSQLQRLAEKGKISEAESKSTFSQISCAASMADLARCDFVVEAIVENFEIKSQLLAKLDALLPKDAILATNTSSISITRLAAATQRSDRVMGVHFMNPVPVMKLVELIRGLQTSDATYHCALELMRKLGKETVLGCDSPGFIVNRILVPMVNEAIFLLQEGVKAEDIDLAMKLGTNQPMGPLTLADFVGLDTLLYILQVLHRELGEDKYRPCPLLVKYVEAGWFGRKSGRGFYRYDQVGAGR